MTSCHGERPVSSSLRTQSLVHTSQVGFRRAPTRWVVNACPSSWPCRPRSPSGTQRLLEGGITRRRERMLAREQLADGAFALVFLVAAVALAVLAPASARARRRCWRPRSWAPTRWSRAPSSPPAPASPCRRRSCSCRCCCCCRRRPSRCSSRSRYVLTTLRRRAARPASPASRALLSVADAWFAIAPALVLVLGGAQTPDWSDWPWYVAALAAQLALDDAVSRRRACGRASASARARCSPSC